jgi:hypothetical protein
MPRKCVREVGVGMDRMGWTLQVSGWEVGLIGRVGEEGKITWSVENHLLHCGF